MSPSTVGVDRAPGYGGCWSGLPTRPILVDHTVLPSATFSAFTSSFCIPSLTMMYIRSPTTDGVEKPSPRLSMRQTSLGPAAGHWRSSPVSVEMPVREGPRHCGQSAASRAIVAQTRDKAISMDRMGFMDP